MNGSNFNRVYIWVHFVEARCLTYQEQIDLEDSGEIEEDEDDFNAFGPNVVSPLKPKYKSIDLKVKLDAESTFTIISNAFVWTYPWVRCRLSVFRGQGDFIASIRKGFFQVLEYELDDTPGISSIKRFYSDIFCVNKRLAFEEYLRRAHPNERDVRLSQFMTLLESWPDELSSELQEYVCKSPEGQVLLLSRDAPNMFKYGSLLFHNKFLSLLEKKGSPEDNSNDFSSTDEAVHKLEDLFAEKYWPLGFNDILYKTTGLSGLEVRLKSLKLTPYYKKLHTLHKNALELYDGFKMRCYRDGHTYLTRRNVESLAQGSWELDGICKFLMENKIISGGEEGIYQLKRFEKAESNISSILKSLIFESPPWKIDWSAGAFTGLRPDKEQEKAARMIARHPITVISGRGGTGKTEIVTNVLSNLEQSRTEEEEETGQKEVSSETKEVVLYVAPTGKAASVIRNRIKGDAYTIHQIIASHKKFMKDPSDGWKYAHLKVLVVDECSMVGLCLFSHLLTILHQDSQLSKIVLLGDILQLPSIDPGNLMSDLFECLSPFGYSIELLTNHRSEGTLIFDNARRISQRKMPIFDEGFHLIEPLWEDRDLSKGCIKLKEWFKNALSKENMDDLRVNAYLKLLVQDAKDYCVDSQKTSQIISFTRKECDILNQLCCKIYNDHFIYSYYGGRKIKNFVDCDKIMCTKNKDVPLFTVKNDVIVDKKDERLMNGSVFVIDSIRTYDMNVRNDEDENRNSDSILTYELNNLLGDKIYAEKRSFDKLCRPTHSWALTIHKFQGSETNTIVYGVSNSRNENWKHVYTAITRGKKKVIIVGSRSHLEAAILRESKPRQTRLKSLMQKVFDSRSERRDMFSSDEELEEGFPSLSDSPKNEINNSLWENNASFDVMLSQMDEVELPKQDVTPPNSPSKKPKISSITPDLNERLKLF